jgi:O-antigen/teichoic acid export membrane protein
MSLLRKNVIANFGGKLTAALTGLAVVPFYQKYLGLEGYGLVSFFITIQAMISILDLGLSTASNREISTITVSATRGNQSRRLLRTMEYVYYGVGLLIFAGIVFSSDLWAYHWIQAKQISPDAIRTCIILAGGTIALRWPISLYSGILLGLERQVLYNCLGISLSITKAVGSILVVVFVANTVVSFYKWQVGFAVVEIALMSLATWWVVSGIRPLEQLKAKFDLGILKKVWRFGFGVGGITVFAMLLKQSDKMIISKLLPIEQLGFYNTACLVYAGITLVFQPMQSAVFPRFTKIFTQGDYGELARIFHRATQTVAFLAAPAACFIAFFSRDILLLWTRSDIVASHAYMPLTLLAITALFNSVMGVPFMLQLSAGLTWLPLYNNGIALLITAPLIWFSVLYFGICGGAMVWLIYNICYYAILPQIMFSYVLSGDKRAWYFEDTLPFMAMAIVVYLIVRWVCNWTGTFWIQLIVIMLGTGIYVSMAVAYSSTLQSLFLNTAAIRMFIRKKPSLHASGESNIGS